MFFPIQNASYIQINLIENVQTYKFGSQNLFRGKRVKHILCITSNEMVTSPDQQPIATNGYFVTLRNNDNQAVIDTVASYLLAPGRENIVLIEPQEIAWEKSEVTVGGNINFGTVLFMQVVFE